MPRTLNRVGEIHNGWEIINYISSRNLEVKSLKTGSVRSGITYGNLISNKVKDLHDPSVCGKGFIGTGEHKTHVGSRATKPYQLWHSMLVRCYSEKSLMSDPSYTDCEVEDSWLNFQNFARDIKDLPGYDLLVTGNNVHLDKDVIVEGNKIYSKETCSFIPESVNTHDGAVRRWRGNCLGGN